MTSPKFVVIEGVDGSGKETQAQLLIAHLKKAGQKVLYLDFPQYEGFYGKIVAMYLRGEFGPISQTSPFLIAMIFALDRSTIRDKIISFLQTDGIIVANRYVPSNIAHQAANIKDEKKQKEFIRWIQQLEYDELKLPHEDAVIYLDLPWEIGMAKSEEKLKNDTHHSYLQGKADIHEKSVEHRQKTAQIYNQLLTEFNHWHKVSCTDAQGKQRSPEDIQQDILSLLHLS